MSWTIPSNEEADEFTRAYLASEESYYEEQVQPVTEKDRNDVLDWLNQIVNTDDIDWTELYSDSEIRLLAKNAIELINAVNE